MARPLRIEYPGAWYHILNRGAGKRRIFYSERDHELFMQLLGETSQIYGIEIHAYSLMGNHYHLLVHTPRSGLSRAMRHLNGIYTQRFNNRQQTDGPLFRGRFKSLLVQSDEYLLELVRYIHMNPVEAGLCRHPRDHRWTSHRAYLFKGLRPKWLKIDEVLSRFDGDERQSLRQMNAFVCERIPESVRASLLKERVILGTQAFKEWVWRNFKDEKPKKGIPLRDERIQRRARAKQILDHVGMAFDVPITQLREGGRFRGNPGRKMAIYLLRRLAGLSQGEVGRWMTERNRAGIAKAVARYEQELAGNRSLRKLAEEGAHQIMSHVKP